MKTTTILNLKGLTLREIFENFLFRLVQFESIINDSEFLITRAFIRLLAYSMTERGTKARALINLFCSAYQKISINWPAIS